MSMKRNLSGVLGMFALLAEGPMAEGKRVKFWAVNIDQPTDRYRYWSTHLETTI